MYVRVSMRSRDGSVFSWDFEEPTDDHQEAVHRPCSSPNCSAPVTKKSLCLAGDAFDIWDEIPSLTFRHYRTNPCLSGCVSDSFNVQYREQD